AAAFFYLFIGNPLLSLYWGCWAGLAISGITMYFFARTILSRGSSLLAAALYMVMHYHLFDFYQRMAQHEFWAFAFGPLMLYGINRIHRYNNSRGIPYLAFGYALLLLTHLPTALIFSILLPVYSIILTRNLRQLFRIAFGFILG